MSLRDLAEGVRNSAAGDPGLSLQFDRVLGAALGSAWRNASESRFDLELADGSLRFYRSDMIPTVPLPLPTEVSGVHFRSDLGNTQSVDPSVLLAEGGIFGAAVNAPGRRGGRK